MGMPVRIDDLLYEQAKAEAQIKHRTITGQIEYWAMVGRAALDSGFANKFCCRSFISSY